MATSPLQIVEYQAQDGQPSFTATDKVYVSLFERPIIITKEDLCHVLGLNPALNLSKEGIQRAARKRLYRLHPDIQSRFDQPIPEELASVLRGDVTRAKEHLIKQEWDFPTEAFTQAARDSNNFNLASFIKGLASTTSGIIGFINTLSYFSNSFITLSALSFFYDGHLLITLLNEYKPVFDAIRPYADKINGTGIEKFVVAVREYASGKDIDVLNQCRDYLPEKMVDEESWQEIITAIDEGREQLLNRLDDKTISNIKGVFDFWPKFVAHLPSYKQLIGVYISAMLLTARTLPNSFMIYFDICSVIFHHKGLLATSLVALPFLAAHMALMPFKLCLLLLQEGTYIALTSGIKLLIEAMNLIVNIVDLFNVFFSDNPISNEQLLFHYFSNLLNIFAIIPMTVAMQMLDSAIYLASGKSVITSYIEMFKTMANKFLQKLNPAPVDAEKVDSKPVEEAPIDIAPEARKTAPANASVRFFAKPDPTTNVKENTWLNDALNYADFYQEAPDAKAIPAI